MAELKGFDANTVEPRKPFEPLPAGKYLAVITESAFEPTSKRTGHFLKLTFEIIEGEHKGKKLFARLNLDNPNSQAVQIAKAELSAICRAVGVMAPNDSTDLHDLPLVIHVRCKKRADTDEITNEIAGYAKKESPAAANAPPAAGPPPWKRS
jgi:hypothetical protein